MPTLDNIQALVEDHYNRIEPLLLVVDDKSIQIERKDIDDLLLEFSLFIRQLGEGYCWQPTFSGWIFENKKLVQLIKSGS